MSFSDNASKVMDLLVSSGERLGVEAIGKRLPGISDITGALEQLMQAGEVWHAGKGRYAHLKTLGMERGTIRIRADGSAFVTAEGSDPLRITVEPSATGGALDRDTVLVRLLEPERTGYKGRVLHVLRRFRTGMAGIMRHQSGGWFLDPLDPRLPRNIPVDTAGMQPANGDLAGCTIDYTGGTVKAVMNKAVGSTDSPKALIDSVCFDIGLPAEFPPEVIKEADLSGASPLGTGTRKDLRGLFAVTVDPLDAKDFDDAVSIEPLQGGGYRLGVHIADVAAYVAPGSALDIEAAERGTSVYLPDRVIPMLPEALSNGACSLRPGEDRLTRTVLIDYDNTGKRQDYSIFSSVIRSRRRLSYSEALELLKNRGREDGELELSFGMFADLNRLLDSQRESRGAVDLGSAEFKTLFDEKGLPCGFEPASEDDSHRMIENFMVEANRAVAEYTRWLELDVLYRVHGEPFPEASDRLRRTLALYGLEMPGRWSPSPSSLSEVVEKARETPVFFLVREAVLRSMQRAVYSPVNAGHYGLALRNYTHFTSPIRRYPDLILHQALTALERGSVPKRHYSMGTAAGFCSDLERRAAFAEMEAVELMALVYLAGNVGMSFPAVVRNVEDFGVFVRLLTVPVEGLVHVSKLRNRSGLVPGSRLTVAVQESDPLGRKLSLVPVEPMEDHDEHE